MASLDLHENSKMRDIWNDGLAVNPQLVMN